MSSYHKYLTTFSLLDVLQPFFPLIAISSTLNICRVFTRGAASVQVFQIILPVTLTFFIPPLVANLVYKQFYVSNVMIGSFLTGFLIFPVLHKIPSVLDMSASFCYIGKFGLLSSMKSNKHSMSNITLWLAINDFVGTFISRVFLNDIRFDVSENALLKLLGNIVLVYICRNYYSSDIFLVILVLSYDAFLFVRERYAGRIDVKEMFAKKTETSTSKGHPNLGNRKIPDEINADTASNKAETESTEKVGDQAAQETVKFSDSQDENEKTTVTKKKATIKVPRTPRKAATTKGRKPPLQTNEKDDDAEQATKKKAVRTPRRK